MKHQDPSEFIAYFSRIRQRTDAVVRRIPCERIEWSLQAGRFTLGDIVRHLASIERFMYAENACGRPSRYPGHGRELADGYDAVLDYFARLHREAMEIFSGLTVADFNGTCRTPGGAEIRVWKWLRAMIEHEIHHRAQIYVYLGVLGVTPPPLFGLTSEQVRAVSVDEDAPNRTIAGQPKAKIIEPMADAQLVLEHSIEADVSPAFAWKFRTDITTWNDPPATFLLDGPFAEGSRGTTLMPEQEPLVWWIRDVQPGHSFAIEMPLDRATLRFEWHLGAVSERRTKLTHRIILSGSNAGAYRQQVESGFGANLAAGVEKIAESMVAAENTSGF